MGSPRITVVTANIGGIDQDHEIPVQSVGFERVYVTTAPMLEGTDREKALYYKCNLHDFDADVTIWLDGKVQVLATNFIQQILDALGEGNLAIMKHLYRSCIYQEIDHIEHCIKHNNQYLKTRYAGKPIRKQVEAYRYFGYPANAGLYDCCIIAVRNGSPGVHHVFKNWWHDVYDLKGFDQVALPFYAWLYGVKIQPVVFKENSFIDVPHKVLK